MKSNSLSRYLKFLPLLALFAFGVTLISLPKSSEATPLGAPTLSLAVVPLQGTTVVTAMYTDDTPAGSANAVLTGSPALGTFLTGAFVSPASDEVVSVSGASVTVTEDTDTTVLTKTIFATFQCTSPGIMTFTVSHGGTTSSPSVTLVCGDAFYGQFPYGQYPYGQFPYGGSGYPYTQYPYGQTTQPTYGTANAVTVAASPASTQCAGTSSISVTVTDVSGALAAGGTSVTVSASTGTVSPNVVSTSGGYATTTFTAPGSSSGTATITATSGTGTGYATVAFSCAGVTTAPVYVPPATQPIYTGPVSIVPPSTGDAGLLEQGRSSTTAGVALIGLSIVGLTAGAWSLRRQHSAR